jgi:hypothetical protein
MPVDIRKCVTFLHPFIVRRSFFHLVPGLMISALIMSGGYLQAGEAVEVINKSDMTILSVSPAVELFKNECRVEQGNLVCTYEIYKSGYKVRLQNTKKKETAVKLELLLDYQGEGKVFDYLVYDIIGPQQTKTIGVMCDNIPVDCLKKRGKETLTGNCNDHVLSQWDKHIKRLVVDSLD